MLLIENAGQWPAAARFQAWGSPLGAGTTWLAEDEIWVVVSRQVDKDQVDKDGRSPCDNPLVNFSTCLPVYSSHALKLTFPGSNPEVRIEPFEALTSTVSYFLGNDPAQWRSDVPVYGGVRYADLYPGVDLVFGMTDALWRLEAEPGAETAQVGIQVEGADMLAVDGVTMRLTAQDELLEIVLPKASFAYQVDGSSAQGEAVALNVGPSIETLRWPAAPNDNPGDLIYSTFLGGSRSDHGYALAVGVAGDATVTGTSWSNDFPTTPGASDPSYNGDTDTFVARIDSASSALVYATFLGGRLADRSNALVMDATGRAIVAGYTQSDDFPITPNAFDPSFNGSSGDAFVVWLNATGSALDYATYLGGGEWDGATALALDSDGRVTVAGSTSSGDFPTTPGAFDPVCSNFGVTDGDAFVVRLNAAGSALGYATCLGSSNGDSATDLALDTSGRVTLVGTTNSSGFPTTPGAFDTSFNGGFGGDTFVLRLSAAGSALDYATFLGGNDWDYGHGVALDAAGRATIAGGTGSSDFPTTPGAFDPSYAGGEAFVVRLNAAGSALDYATALGGSDWDIAQDLVVDADGRATVVGVTRSRDFPSSSGAFDPSFNGSYDAFVARLNAAGSALDYATFLGGGWEDRGEALAMDAGDRVTVTGYSGSPDFPITPGAIGPFVDMAGSAYITVLEPSQSLPISPWHTEAESGTRTGSMEIGRDEAGASACQYVYDAQRMSGSTVTYNVAVLYADDYFLWARAKASVGKTTPSSSPSTAPALPLRNHPRG